MTQNIRRISRQPLLEHSMMTKSVSLLFVVCQQMWNPGGLSLNCFAVSLLQFCFRERRGACQWHHRQWCCWSDRYRTGYSIKSASDVIRVSRVLDGTDKITLTIVGEWILATMTYLVCSVVSRAANDPSVFTNKEKAPTSSFKRHYAYQLPKYGKLIWNWDLGHRCKNLLTVG